MYTYSLVKVSESCKTIQPLKHIFMLNCKRTTRKKKRIVICIVFCDFALWNFDSENFGLVFPKFSFFEAKWSVYRNGQNQTYNNSFFLSKTDYNSVRRYSSSGDFHSKYKPETSGQSPYSSSNKNTNLRGTQTPL